MNWWNRMRLRSLQRQLAQIRAEIEQEQITERQTGGCYPNIRTSNARKKAGLEFDIARLSGHTSHSA